MSDAAVDLDPVGMDGQRVCRQGIGKGRRNREHVWESGHFDRLGKVSFSTTLKGAACQNVPTSIERER